MHSTHKISGKKGAGKMRLDPVTVKDKLGRDVVLRSADVADAEDLIKYLKVTTAETPFLIREPDEVTLTVEQEKLFIEMNTDSVYDLMMVATIDGRHVGNCSVSKIGRFKRYAHRCDIAIALYQEYCGAGIGRIMLENALMIAKAMGYEQAELEVIADNKNAIALYEKLGFVRYGTFPDNMKYSDGSYADAFWMMKKL